MLGEGLFTGMLWAPQLSFRHWLGHYARVWREHTIFARIKGNCKLMKFDCVKDADPLLVPAQGEDGKEEAQSTHLLEGKAPWELHACLSGCTVFFSMQVSSIMKLSVSGARHLAWKERRHVPSHVSGSPLSPQQWQNKEAPFICENPLTQRYSKHTRCSKICA